MNEATAEATSILELVQSRSLQLAGRDGNDNVFRVVGAYQDGSANLTEPLQLRFQARLDHTIYVHPAEASLADIASAINDLDAFEASLATDMTDAALEATLDLGGTLASDATRGTRTVEFNSGTFTVTSGVDYKIIIDSDEFTVTAASTSLTDLIDLWAAAIDGDANYSAPRSGNK